ncbi:hypothetical protein DQE80_17955, partial [Enterococcus sp. HPCN18]
PGGHDTAVRGAGAVQCAEPSDAVHAAAGSSRCAAAVRTGTPGGAHASALDVGDGRRRQPALRARRRGGDRAGARRE